MAERSRYSLVNEGVSREGVLRNKLDIKDQKTLDDVEAILLDDAYTHFFQLLEQGEIKIDLPLLFDLHRFFLSPLYSWAGKLRTVDISKDEVLFASVRYLKDTLVDVEHVVQRNIPKESETKKGIAKRLALIHCELNAIHPFREGNGRTIRLFLDLLIGDIGYEPIDWSKRSRRFYVQACIDGMSQDYLRMERIIYAGLIKRK